MDNRLIDSFTKNIKPHRENRLKFDTNCSTYSGIKHIQKTEKLSYLPDQILQRTKNNDNFDTLKISLYFCQGYIKTLPYCYF